jgi:hypothetical protein
MTNQTTDVENYRNELRTLNTINEISDIGPITKKAIHERMLIVAFRLQEALNAPTPSDVYAQNTQKPLSF